MKRRHILTCASLLLLIAPETLAAADWIVQFKNSSQVQSLVQKYGGSNVRAIHAGLNLYKVAFPNGSSGDQQANQMHGNSGIQSMEKDRKVGLQKAPGYNSGTHNRVSLQPGCAYSIPFGTPGYWTSTQRADYNAYVGQLSNCVVDLPKAQAYKPGGYGSVKVAVIDTGVDCRNPVLTGSCKAAVDETGNGDIYGTLAQETSPMVDQETSPMVDQETSPMVDSTGTIVLNQETSPMVDQETSPMVDKAGNALPSAFGHGTMVAGIVHLVAPNASIYSYKAFANDGTATLGTLAQAFADAMSAGVDVINASWSTSQNSPILQSMITAAQAQNIIVVAAVANNHNAETVYPAAYPGVIGVACTDNTDTRCSFSDFGSDVMLTAPGSGITTTFPIDYTVKTATGTTTIQFNGFATGWGTSFSTPYVAGAAALIRSLPGHAGWNIGLEIYDLGSSAVPLGPGPKMGFGRVDVYGAVVTAH